MSSDSKTLTFNQFGFVDESDAVALNFELNCIVKIGTAPTCSSTALVQSRREMKVASSERVAGKVTHQTRIDSSSGSQQIGNLALAISPKTDEYSAATILAPMTLAVGLSTLL